MNFIAAVDNNWAIGNKGKLLARISEDQKFFRTTTMGHVVVLGRKTLEEFPNSKPLKGRTNIILSTNQDYVVEGATVVHSYKELFDVLSNYDEDDIYIIGGMSVYNDLIPYCKKGVITKIYKEYEADAHIINLDDCDNWQIVSCEEKMSQDDLEFQFMEYENNNVKIFE